MTVGGLTVITIADNRMTNWPSQTQSAQSVVLVAHCGNNDARRKKRGGWILMNAQLRWLAAESIWADQSLLWKQNKTTFVCQTNRNFLLNKEAETVLLPNDCFTNWDCLKMLTIGVHFGKYCFLLDQKITAQMANLFWLRSECNANLAVSTLPVWLASVGHRRLGEMCQDLKQHQRRILGHYVHVMMSAVIYGEREVQTKIESTFGSRESLLVFSSSLRFSVQVLRAAVQSDRTKLMLFCALEKKRCCQADIDAFAASSDGRPTTDNSINSSKYDARARVHFCSRVSALLQIGSLGPARHSDLSWSRRYINTICTKKQRDRARQNTHTYTILAVDCCCCWSLRWPNNKNGTVRAALLIFFSCWTTLFFSFFSLRRIHYYYYQQHQQHQLVFWVLVSTVCLSICLTDCLTVSEHWAMDKHELSPFHEPQWQKESSGAVCTTNTSAGNGNGNQWWAIRNQCKSANCPKLVYLYLSPFSISFNLSQL